MLKLNQGWSGVVMTKLNQLKICILEAEYWHWPLWKNQKWLAFCKYVSCRKKSNYWPPPQSLSFWFSKCWNHWRLSNLEFCCMMIFNKMVSIFCIMAYSKFSFMLTLGKAETQTLGGSVILNFTVWWFFVKWGPFYPSSFMCDDLSALKRA